MLAMIAYFISSLTFIICKKKQQNYVFSSQLNAWYEGDLVVRLFTMFFLGVSTADHISPVVSINNSDDYCLGFVIKIKNNQCR